ncbi:MAG: hypothetical protein LBI59_00945, partial [Candidatus Accumulibacter sp.]|nr:hypothetical protein [Accumulibacter sp.]
MAEKPENTPTEKPQSPPAEPKNSLLTKVFIEGLLGVGDVELNFAPGQRVHVLFGENGIGKTKCLEALYLNLLRSNEDFKVFLKEKQKEQSKLVLIDGRTHYVGLKLPSLGQVQPKLEIHRLPVVFLGAGQRANVGEMPELHDGLGTFKVRQKKCFDGLYQALCSSALNNLGMADDTRTWFVARAQSANPYQKSKDDRSVEIDAVLAILHEIDPHIDSKVLRIDGDGRVFLSVDGQERELGELSSGYAALVKMVQ